MAPFFRWGVSIPTLNRHGRSYRPELPLTFRVQLLMALLTHADELPLSGLWVPDAKRQVRPIPQVLNVMHDDSPPEPAFGFAPLALRLIEPSENIFPQGFPFRPFVEQCFPALPDKRPQLCEP